MRRLLAALAAIAAIAALAAPPAWAQSSFPTPQGNANAPGFVVMCPTGANAYVPCGAAGARPLPVVVMPPSLPIPPAGYPPNTIPITGNNTGTTGAVVGTLAGSQARTTFICGFDVSAIGGTATVGPITIANLVSGSMVFELASLAAGNTLSTAFSPCVPASATNTAITITTTADGTASAVAVNSWGFQQ